MDFVECMPSKYGVDPQTVSYSIVILALTKAGDYDGADLWLKNMEEAAISQAEERKRKSIIAPALVELDLESYNIVLASLAKSGLENAATKAEEIIGRMQKLGLTPTTRSWNGMFLW